MIGHDQGGMVLDAVFSLSQEFFERNIGKVGCNSLLILLQAKFWKANFCSMLSARF